MRRLFKTAVGFAVFLFAAGIASQVERAQREAERAHARLDANLPFTNQERRRAMAVQMRREQEHGHG